MSSFHNRKASGSSEENDFDVFYATLQFRVKYKSRIGQI